MKFEDLKEPQAEIGTMESVIENSVIVAAAAGSGSTTATCSYKECMKNHAAMLGGNAVDGCAEFMSSGECDTVEYFICAACSCHRNFHRKEVIESGGTFVLPPQLHVQVELGSIANGGHGQEQEGLSNTGPKKRFRTKFTDVEREKMRKFAEKLGWKIQKHDEADIEQFCKDTCVKKRVLKMWIHNHRKAKC